MGLRFIDGSTARAIDKPHLRERMESCGNQPSLGNLLTEACLSIIYHLSGAEMAAIGMTCKWMSGLVQSKELRNFVEERVLSRCDGNTRYMNFFLSLGVTRGYEVATKRPTNPLQIRSLFDRTTCCRSSSQLFLERSQRGGAIGYDVMKSGQHYLSVRMVTPSPDLEFHIGVMRPLADWSKMDRLVNNLCGGRTFPFNGANAHLLNGDRTDSWKGTTDCAVVSLPTGIASHSYWARGSGNGATRMRFLARRREHSKRSLGRGEVGLLFDQDEGTIAMFLNGVFVEVVADGLEGPFCWVVCMSRKKTCPYLRAGTTSNSSIGSLACLRVCTARHVPNPN